MSNIKLYVLTGTPENVASREAAILAGLTGQGYNVRTLMRLEHPDILEYLSGETPGTAGNLWRPDAKPGDCCVVLSVKK